MSESTISTPEHLTVLDFMKFRKLAAGFSIVLLLLAMGSLLFNGLQFGLDFTGGTQIELEYEQPADLQQVRAQLTRAGFEGAVVNHFGVETEVMVRLQQMDEPKRNQQPDAEVVESLSDRVYAALSADGQAVEIKRSEFVGPQVGDELRDQGGLGMLVALLVVMGYVAFRFQYKFSVGAVLALVHDVVIVLGVFSLLHLDFDLTVLAAILAVIGYSLNDTIVVSDRIRENFRKIRQSEPEEIVNISLSETLGRTLVTSLTTLLVLAALYFVGGQLIQGFAIALIIGVVIGTYSSIYVAANVLLAMNISTQDLIEPVREGAELDEMP